MKMNLQDNFILYACCIPVKGYTNSIICDIQRGSFKFIPSSLYDLLLSSKGKTVGEIYSDTNYEDHATINEYFDFLIENEFGFFTDQPESFPEIKLNYEQPSLISNAIVDVDKSSTHNYDDIFRQLSYLGCKTTQLRFFDTIGTEALQTILSSSEGSTFSIELLLKYDCLENQRYEQLLHRNQRVTSVIVHSSDRDEIKLKGHNGVGELLFVRKEINSAQHCGEISPFLFSINIETFSEASFYNSCLNKKISIDVNGNIRNCPSMGTSFGSINTTRLSDVLLNEDFISPWSIKKDVISVCQDCEFRYICTDCRAYVKDTSNPYSKPLKCNYDPYTGVWN